MGGPMPSLALGLTSCTAWASTCAAEWRRTARPSSEPTVTGSTTSPSASTWARSRSWPFTRATTTALSSPNRSAAVVSAATDRSLPATDTVMRAGTRTPCDERGYAARSGGAGRSPSQATWPDAIGRPAGPARQLRAGHRVADRHDARGLHGGVDTGAAGRDRGEPQPHGTGGQHAADGCLELLRGQLHDEVGPHRLHVRLGAADHVHGGLLAAVPHQPLGLDLDRVQALARLPADGEDPDARDHVALRRLHGPRLSPVRGGGSRSPGRAGPGCLCRSGWSPGTGWSASRPRERSVRQGQSCAGSRDALAGSSTRVRNRRVRSCAGAPITCAGGPSSTTTPPSMKITRS